MTLFAGRFAFANAAAAAGGDAIFVRAPTSGQTYDERGDREDRRHDHAESRRTSTLRRITPNPSAASSAIRIMIGRL